MKVFVCLLALAASASAGFLGGLAPHGGVISGGLASHGGVISGANGLHTITIQEEAPGIVQAQPQFIHAQPEYKTLLQEAPAAQFQFAAAPAPAPAHAVQYLSAGAPAHSVLQSAGAPAFSFLQGGAGGLPAGYELLSGAVGSVGSAVNVLQGAAHSVAVAPSVQYVQAAPAPAYKTIQVAQPAAEYKTIQVAQPAVKTIQLLQEAFPAEHKTILHGGHHEHAKFLQYLKK